eukprot:2681417-Pyramimonas_sp.AAC.4
MQDKQKMKAAKKITKDHRMGDAVRMPKFSSADNNVQLSALSPPVIPLIILEVWNLHCCISRYTCSNKRCDYLVVAAAEQSRREGHFEEETCED